MTVTIKMNRTPATVKATEESFDAVATAAKLWGEGTARITNEVDRFNKLRAQYEMGRASTAAHREAANQAEAERVVAEYFLREFDIKLV